MVLGISSAVQQRHLALAVSPFCQPQHAGFYPFAFHMASVLAASCHCFRKQTGEQPLLRLYTMASKLPQSLVNWVFSVYSFFCSKKAKRNRLKWKMSQGAYSLCCTWHVTFPKGKCQLEIQACLQPLVRMKDQGPSIF